MYAIIHQGGRQYRVAPGDVIQIDKLGVEKGAQLELRVTGGDVALRERKLAFHIGEAPPRVSRFVMESTAAD